MNLTEIIREISNRERVFKAITAITGGLYGTDSVVMTNTGSGYTANFSVTFSNGGTGTAVVEDGEVVSVAVLTRGSAVAGAVTIDFSAGDGADAAGTVIVTPLTLDAVATVGTPKTKRFAMIDVGGTTYLYSLRNVTTAESSPDVVRPDDYAASTNEQVWILQARFKDGAPMVKNINGGATPWHTIGCRNLDDATPSLFASDSGIA